MSHKSQLTAILKLLHNSGWKELWSYMCSLIEIMCVVEQKIGLVCWQLPHDVYATEIFFIFIPTEYIC